MGRRDSKSVLQILPSLAVQPSTTGPTTATTGTFYQPRGQVVGRTGIVGRLDATDSTHTACFHPNFPRSETLCCHRCNPDMNVSRDNRSL